MVAMAARNTLRGGIKVRLCVLALCIGICSVCCILTLGAAAEAAVAGEIDQLGLGGIVFYVEGKSYRASQGDIAAVGQVSGVRAVMPMTVRNGYLWLRNQGGQALICAADQGLENVFTLNLLHGRRLTRQDVGSAARVAIIDDALARAAYSRANIVGKPITLSVDGISETFTVVGVIASQKQGLEQLVGSAIPSLIYIPSTALSAMTGESGQSLLAVSCLSRETSPQVAQQVQARLEGLTGQRFRYENLTELTGAMQRLTAIVSLFVAAVAGISILVGGLGVMNIMIAAVEARTREIGIHIALGAGRGTLVCTFLLEAQIIALAGGLLGIGLCAALLGVAARLSGQAIPISPSAMGVSLVCTSLCGTIFGCAPALRAAGLDPIRAIRQEL